nr:diguanylate cyclase [uncultured Desulfuromonas sp.]
MTVAMMALIVLFHTVIHQGQMVKAEEAVYNLLQVQRAIRAYVKETIRPEMYRLEEQGILQPGYFSPELMSRSYVSREVLKLFIDSQGKEFSSSVFRYASLSPHNLKNLATPFEEQLLKRFAANEISEYCEKIIQGGEEILFYAVPLDRFGSSCMGCHSDPALAPPSLVQRYGDSHGFHRRPGELSGLMSISIPLASFKDQCAKTSAAVAVLTAIGFVGVFFLIRVLLAKKDVQDLLLEQQNAELDRLSTTDPLTGLWNRLRFNHEIVQLISQVQTSEEPLAMLIIDIDHFKEINDSHGHSTGDEVLKIFGAFLQQQSRKTDFVSRVGGEEFVILTVGMNRYDLGLFAQRLLDKMTEVTYPHGLRVTASLGIALYHDGEDHSLFFSRADKAMYQSKEKGRFCYTIEG